MTRAITSDLFERIRFRGRPAANPQSVVVAGNSRFTVLTPRLLRLEWSPAGQFEDRGTYAFPTRCAPAPPFTVRTEGDDRIVDTGALTLRYRQDDGPFTAANLSISFDLHGERQVWRPGMVDPANLRGTRRTLDACEGDASLAEGLLSRAGWALFDDSRSILFDPTDGWVKPRPEGEAQDCYFFGYGHDYRAALADYTRFGGPVPLIPRFVLGAWWSRYWAYSARELQELVQDFDAHGLPLDVLVVDMDWHTSDAWTGYTWNRELFPDPAGFLRWVHEKGLRVTLNLHPAGGVQPFEEVYPRFAEAMGVDPASREPIPFRSTDKRFVRNYFELLHHPMEDEGVDFWWMDWQQGEGSEMEGLDPLPWLNHLHFHDSTRRGGRPMLYSRWGGLGNHRYPIGFSGDTIVGWPALQFQPYFTATAANVAFGWWSHDIGGHMGRATEPELYARWVQFGALSPCLRLHATKDPCFERRPWEFPQEAYQAAKAAFQWRYRLIPYLYTMARVTHDSGLPLCRPLYYEYPEEEAAYVARHEYFLGDQGIAAPIVHPADAAIGMAAADVWVPEGTWIDYATKELFSGPRWVRLVGGLERVPLLLKAGAILPLAAPFGPQPSPRLASGTTDAIPQDALVLSIFPGEGHFRLYEDDGISEDYGEGQCEWTEITTHQEGEGRWEVRIAAVEGHCRALPRQRRYEVRLEGSRPPARVTLDGRPVSDWAYEVETLTTVIPVPARDKGTPLAIAASAASPISALGKARNADLVRADVQRLLGRAYPEKKESLEALLDAVLQADAPGWTDAIARLGGPFVRLLEYVTPEEASRQLGRLIVGAPAPGGGPYDLEATFTLFDAGRPQHHTIRLQGATESQIIPTPFAFDGRVRAMRWEAQVRIAWRGRTLSHTHSSKPIFPSIYTWRALVYDREKEAVPLEQVVAGGGPVPPDLPWKVYTQEAGGLRNLNEPYLLRLGTEYRERLRAGEPLTACLATTAISPDEREALLLFGSGGRAEIYLNGRKVEEGPVPAERGYPFLRGVRQTAPFRLRAGENLLVVACRPAERADPSWYFAAALVTPGGDWMTDLSYLHQRG